MRLWNNDHGRRELEARVGDIRQIADIRLVQLDDGNERGVRAAFVRTGSGLDFSVLLDRALDIDLATYNGIPLTWQSGTGAVHPARYEAGARGWHLNFHGGLFTLCGLTNAGRPVPDVDPETGEPLVTHGRISNTPAYDIGIERAWSDDERSLTLRLRGTVDDVSLGGYRLRLQRTISVNVGEPKLTIEDRVTNLGGMPAPLMLLYHCNFGWPLISADTELSIPSRKVIPYNEQAERNLETWMKLSDPAADYSQEAFFHELDPVPATTITIRNPQFQFGVNLSFDARTLNHLTHWKMLGFSDYVLGIEPGNCRSEGRVSAREGGRLRYLPPGDTDHFLLTVEITS